MNASEIIAEMKKQLAAQQKTLAQLEKSLGSETPAETPAEKPMKEDKKDKKPPTEYQIFTSEISKLVKEALAGEKMKRGFHQKVTGYMKKTAKTSATLENVKDAMKYLNDHPEYVSAHAEKMSSKNSVASDAKTETKPKNKGRPKASKAKAEAKVEAEEAKEEVEDDIELDQWEFEDTSYLKSQYDDVMNEEGEYLGFYNGSTIDTTAKMPRRIEKFLQTQ